jgi:hypothetical protein
MRTISAKQGPNLIYFATATSRLTTYPAAATINPAMWMIMGNPDDLFKTAR